jgi:hypothetical protein
MARGFTSQTVLLATLLAAMACSQTAMAAEADENDAPVAATPSRSRSRIKQPARLTSSQTFRNAVLEQSDDDAPPAPREVAPKPWSDAGPPAPVVDSQGAMPRCDQCGGCEGCCKCCMCGPPGRFWVRDEYLGFWTKGASLPVLVTTTPTGTLPATETLFGGNTVNNGFRSGNWIQGGMWFDCCQTWGIQGNYFFLGSQSTNYNNMSDGDPVLARPFIDATTGLPSQQLIAFPGTVVGSVHVNDTTGFQGAGVQLRRNICCQTCCDQPCDNGCSQGCGLGCGRGCFQGQNCCRLDALVGFQYYNFNDSLNITEHLTSTSTTNGVPVGTMITVRDSFRTQNNFYGVSLGAVYNKYRGRWVHELQGIVSLGTDAQRISINGNTTNSFPGSPTSTAAGGLYALQSNIGNYTHNNFAAIPQLSARLGYRVTERLTAYVGYTFIYWGSIATAGNQINQTININNIPPVQPGGPNQPSFNLHESSFWAQGITLGGQYNF